MRACVVHSVDVDSSDAVAELISSAKAELGASLPRVALLFANAAGSRAMDTDNPHPLVAPQAARSSTVARQIRWPRDVEDRHACVCRS